VSFIGNKNFYMSSYPVSLVGGGGGVVCLTRGIGSDHRRKIINLHFKLF
jgi:hypothetical protein